MFPALNSQYQRNWKFKAKGKEQLTHQEREEYLFKFKLTLICGFI